MNIVESLNNPTQRRHRGGRPGADQRARACRPRLRQDAGAGASHRLPDSVKRENPHGILALAYNRHAAVEIRRRLAELIGDDARGVMVLTCHALAMRWSARASRGAPIVWTKATSSGASSSRPFRSCAAKDCLPKKRTSIEHDCFEASAGYWSTSIRI